jgi:hypothetical protein
MSFEFVPGFNSADYFDFSHYVHERPRGTNVPRGIWRCRICGREVVVASRKGHLRKVHPEVFRESTAKEAFP